MISVVEFDFISILSNGNKKCFLQASETYNPGFGKDPKIFDTVEMRELVGKLIVAVFHSKMLLTAKAYQSATATPGVRVDNAFKLDSPSDYLLESGF
jgi:hypothetical protein